MVAGLTPILKEILTSGHSLSIASGIVGLLIAAAYWRINENDHDMKTVGLCFVLGFTIVYSISGLILSIFFPKIFLEHPQSSLIIQVGSASLAIYGVKTTANLAKNGDLEDVLPN